MGKEEAFRLLYGKGLEHHLASKTISEEMLFRKSMVEQLLSIRGPAFMDGEFLMLKDRPLNYKWASAWVEMGEDPEQAELHLP